MQSIAPSELFCDMDASKNAAVFVFVFVEIFLQLSEFETEFSLHRRSHERNLFHFIVDASASSRV